MEANEQLMRKVAAVQAEVIEETIKKWYEEELRKANIDPTQYLKA